jgi:hypothetical protein
MNHNLPTDNQFHSRLSSGLTIVAALARLIPHPPNFTPVGGMSLYAGARMRGWRAYAMPMVLMAVTDALLKIFFGYSMFRFNTPFVYGAFLINVMIGRVLLKKFSVSRLAAATLLCSTQFFLITNFAIWMTGEWYPLTLAGLATCFTVALPYFGNTLAGDAVYTGLLFGLHALAERSLAPKHATATA